MRCGIVFALGWLGAATLLAQTLEEAAPAVRTALDALERAEGGRVRFTYLDRSHTLNYNEKGKQTADFTQVFDVTYIAGIEYARLVEVNGKPLMGRALREEQARYDAAIRERSALDDAARARLEHHLQKDAGIDLSAIAKGYRDTVVDRQTIDGRECLVVAALPGENGGSKQYRLWLDPAQARIVRLDFEQIRDEGEMLRGSHGSKRWIYLDGTPLVTQSAADATYLVNGRDRVRVIAEHMYSGFRRFTATATIVPVSPK